jgi:type I restriction-modification system DNA methylase subunit
LSLSNEELSKYSDAANTLREDLDAAEYKHIVLGLVFLKFISDAFSERRSELEKQFDDPKSDTYKKDERARKIALDERDYYMMANVFWVPKKPDGKSSNKIPRADRAKVAENLNRAVYEVHKKCTEVGVESEIPVENLADTPSDQRKYKIQTDHFYLGTSDYEFRGSNQLSYRPFL